MDRQPLTDRLGDRLLAEYGGAAAAYSLRALNGNGDSVVRVRRESDNDEKDFTAEQIELGEMVNWVNEQITPPLDLRELTATGRDGPIIEAAAAYSLRNLSDSYTGSVVEVRRSSDDAVRSFTAAEVTDGTLEDWVNENTLSTARNYTIMPFDTFTGASSSGFTASNSSLNGFAGWDINSGMSGDVIKVSFDLNITSGSPKISLRQAYNDITLASNENIEYNTSGSYTVTLTASGNFSFVAFTEGDIPSSFTVSNFKIIADGTVSKWYDQSTTSGVPNAKHAVQTSAGSQPKIVDGGSLVLRGNKPSINFFNNALESPVVISQQTMSVFTYAQPAADGDTGIELRNRCLLASGTSFSLAGPNSSGQWGFRYSGVVTFPYSTSNILSMNLHTFLGGTTGANYFSSGSNVYTDTVVRSNSTLNGFTIGRKPHITAHNTRGYISEMIIYNTDQSDNRTALEANIGEVYGIAGIPAYEDTVNGFVETWYDQSGNGNDATQLTAGNQPKIVDAGALVIGGLDFDGLGDVLETSLVPPNVATLIGVANWDVINVTGIIIGARDSIPQRSYLAQVSTGKTALGVASSPLSGPDVVAGDDYLLFGTYSGLTRLLSTNGSVVSDSSGSSPNNTIQGYSIGALNNAGANSSFMTGTIGEVIVYPSDETANRLAIEANINNQYDIY